MPKDRSETKRFIALVLENTQRTSARAEIVLHRAAQLQCDAQKEERLKQLECPYCYYIQRGGIAGQALTEYTCSVCEGAYLHPNTDTPEMCQKCACEIGLCRRCGGWLDPDKPLVASVNSTMAQAWEKLNGSCVVGGQKDG